jgi:hypothetical protein
MDAIRVFRCDDANAFLGLLLGGFVVEVIYRSGDRTRIRRLWFLSGAIVGALPVAQATGF